MNISEAKVSEIREKLMIDPSPIGYGNVKSQALELNVKGSDHHA